MATPCHTNESVYMYIAFTKCPKSFYMKGYGTLSITKCPLTNHISDMWNNCPQPYVTLLRLF